MAASGRATEPFGTVLEDEDSEKLSLFQAMCFRRPPATAFDQGFKRTAGACGTFDTEWVLVRPAIRRPIGIKG